MRLSNWACVVFLVAIIPHAQATDLAQSWQWKKLLQYNERGYSEIEQMDFFFSPTGHHDPHAELAAARSAFQSEPELVCQYPARALFLMRAGLIAEFDSGQCEALVNWQKSATIDQASLVFADGYLKNPASFHGHLFLNLSNSQSPYRLLDNSLNYGAEVPQNVDPVTYIAKGLFGGYRARYSSQHFYRHNLSYGRIELRNLWDYQLNISASDAQLLSAHLFELASTDYQYYFMSKNCAYYVARALELVAGTYLVSDSDWTVFPSEVVAHVAAPELHLVHSITLNESEQKRFQSQYNALPDVLKNAVDEWVYHQPEGTLFTQLTAQDQKRVLITLASYFDFLLLQNPDEAAYSQQRQQVLRALLRYEPGNNHQVVAAAEQPHLGQPPNMVRFSYLNLTDQANTWELTVRPTYYDRLQPKIGKPKHSELMMGELTVSQRDGSLLLERLSLFNLTSLNVSNTGLPGDGGESWLLAVGAERRRFRTLQAPLAVYVEGGYGKAHQFDSGVVFYALAGARLHDKEAVGDDHNLTLTGRVGVEGTIGERTWLCEFTKPLAVSQRVTAQRLHSQCAAALYQSQSSDLRLTVEHQQYLGVKLGWSFFF